MPPCRKLIQSLPGFVYLEWPCITTIKKKKKILRLLGQIIGTLIRIDYNTESAIRGKFARIAVEVALNKPLVSQFLLDGKLQKVENESFPYICFNCGTYGHNKETSPEQII